MSRRPFNHLVSVVLAAILMLQAGGVSACVNTRYSRDEERQLTSDAVKLIMGQFAHHGDYFYELELDKTARELAAEPGNVEARNDRAVAHLKLQDYERAEAELLSIEASHPGRYRTHANLGVLYKKMGRFPEAAASVRRSLEIQPEGHLGLGDYYVRMIDWLDDRANAPLDMRWVRNPEDDRRAQPQTNFLGIAYGADWTVMATNAVVKREYLETLIKADRNFADALVLLGDVLAHAGEKELAYRAYVRARDDLDHPALTAIGARLKRIHSEWQEEARVKPGQIVLPKRSLQKQVQLEAKDAGLWVESFASTETDLLTKGQTPDFNAVKAEMKARNLAEPRYIFAGVVKGSASNPVPGFSWLSLLVALSVLGTALWIVCRVLRWLLRLLRNAMAKPDPRAGLG